MSTIKALARYGIAACLALLGLAGVIAFALHHAGDAQPQVEAWLKRSLERPVRVGGLHASWDGWGPRIDARNVDVYDESGTRSVLHFDTLRADLDLPYLIRHLTLGPSELTIVGATVTLTRGADGRINLEGFGAKATDSGGAELAKRWLARQKHLRIQARELHWRDALGATPAFVAKDVTLALKNANERHQVDVAASVGGAPMRAAFDVRGDLFEPSKWNGSLHLQASALALRPWSGGEPVKGWRLEEGVADVRAWASLSRGRIESVRGRAQLTELQLATAHARSSLQRLAGTFRWERHADNWRMTVSDLRMTHAGVESVATPLTVEWKGGNDAQLQLAFKELASAPLMDILRASAAITPELAGALDELSPSARLIDGYARYRPRTGETLVQARFADVSTRPWRGVPGVSALRGRVTLTQDGGVVELEGTPAKLDFAGLFRAPLDVRAISGVLAWERDGGGWRLRAPDIRAHNADLRLRAHFGMSIPAGGASPLMDLVVGFGDGNGRHTSRYLPAGIMPASVVHWLDRAIVAGHVTGGGAVVRGALRDFPFDAGTGRFEVRFNLSDGILDYAEGWPRLEEIETEVAFVGRRMEINGYAAKIFAADVSDTRVEIPDLSAHPAVVHIRGVARGDASDGLRYLLESPLSRDFGIYLSGGRASGASRLDLELALPLDHTHATLNADLHLDEAALHLDDVDLTGLGGILHISDRGLSATAISGRVLGQPATVAVSTRSGPGGAMATIFSAEGSFTTASLARRWPSAWWKAATGEADWRGSLSLPRAAPGAPVAATLHVESALRGIAISLPEPLNKASAETLPLSVDTRLPLNAEAATTIRLGTRAAASLAWRKDAAGTALAGGALRLGAASAPAAEAGGWMVSGELPRFSWSEWAPWLAPAADGGGTAAPVLRKIDVRVRQLEAFGQGYTDIALDARRTAEGWEARLGGPHLEGVVVMPHAPGATVRADLQTLRVAAPQESKTPTGSAQDFDPRAVPPLDVSARHFWYDDADIGALRLRASRSEAGLRFEELQLTSSFWSIRGSGDWRGVGAHQLSSVIARIDASNLGKALGAMGYADTLSGGAGHMALNASWAGGPAAFSLARLNGNLRLNMEKGYLLDVEPGAGRIFGLLSPYALPRRLSLDFGDFFRKGLAFDRISGDFRIENGNAFTDNLTVDGPAAHVEVKGRIGLGERNYDQLATVVPHLTGGLPLAGAVVGGVGVGAAVFVMEQLLKPQIEHITRVEYSIKGGWDAPQVERVTKDAKP